MSALQGGGFPLPGLVSESLGIGAFLSPDILFVRYPTPYRFEAERVEIAELARVV